MSDGNGQMRSINWDVVFRVLMLLAAGASAYFSGTVKLAVAELRTEIAREYVTKTDLNQTVNWLLRLK